MNRLTMTAIFGLLMPLLAACHATQRVDSTGPTVTYRYQYGELDLVHEEAEAYCLQSYGEPARLISADDSSGVATFECTY